MADKKIWELPFSGNLSGSTVLPIGNGLVTEHTSLSAVTEYLKTYTVQSLNGYNVDNTNPNYPIILPVQVDGVTITGTGEDGNPLVANPPTITLPVGKTLFVDPTTGDDATAQPERFDLMYQTYQAAKAAATAGDLIILYPGTYSLTEEMQFLGGKVFAHPGVIIEGYTIITDNNIPDGEEFCLYGSAVLRATGYYAGYFYGSGNIQIECDKIIGAYVYSTIRYAKLKGDVKIKCNYMTSLTTTTLWLEGSNNDSRLIMDVLHFDNSTSGYYEMPIYVGGSFTGNANLNFQLATSTPNRGSIGGNFLTVGSSNEGCNFNMSIQELIDPAPGGNTILGQGEGGVFNINVVKYSGRSLIFSGFATGGVIWNINIDYAKLSGFVAKIQTFDNCNLSGFYESSAIAATMITGFGNSKIKLSNYQSISLDAVGVTVEDDSILIINQATIITNGTYDGFKSSSPKTIIVNGIAATNGGITNITNAVTGTMLISDPNITL